MSMQPKLIRSNLPEDDNYPTYRIEDENIHLALMGAKLYEETSEIISSGFDSVDEYADLLQVINDLVHMVGLDMNEIELVRRKKSSVRGNFRKGMFMPK